VLTFEQEREIEKHRRLSCGGEMISWTCISRKNIAAGGRGGIRTLDTAMRYSGFRDRPIQPLSHPSVWLIILMEYTISFLEVQTLDPPKEKTHYPFCKRVAAIPA
jgi:hypothetical protein